MDDDDFIRSDLLTRISGKSADALPISDYTYIALKLVLKWASNASPLSLEQGGRVHFACVSALGNQSRLKIWGMNTMTNTDYNVADTNQIILRSVRQRLREAKQLLRHTAIAAGQNETVRALIDCADLAVSDLANWDAGQHALVK